MNVLMTIFMLMITWLFPHWLGINTIPDLIAATIAFVLCSILYICIGYGICPASIQSRIIRYIIMVLWPVYVLGLFLLQPVLFLLYVSNSKNK